MAFNRQNMITYFHRNNKCGYSIYKVFNIIENQIKKDFFINEYFTPSPNSMPWDIIRNCWYVYKHRNKVGINHISGHIHDTIIGLIGCKTVLTIHDTVFLDNVKNPIKRFYKWLFWLYIPIKFASVVTCISKETKKHIIKNIKIDNKKITVIYNPVDPSYQFTPKKFNSQKPTILHIGTGWNKNLDRTILALKGISCHLRIIGTLSQKTLSLLKENDIEYSNICNLTDEEIKQEYINCDIVNFPSIYEGFGMPIIEGQQIGRVVITSNIEPIIDISGKAALLINPYETDNIRKAYLDIISNKDLRNNLIQKGLNNVKRFEASFIAKQYIDLYNTL